MNPIVTFSNGLRVINTTPHALTFLDGDAVITVPVSPFIVSGSAIEADAGNFGPVSLVKTVFRATKEGYEALNEIAATYGEDVLPIGSIIAAQAYPGEVFGMTPAPGFERVPPAEKRMSTSKFTTF